MKIFKNLAYLFGICSLLFFIFCETNLFPTPLPSDEAKRVEYKLSILTNEEREQLKELFEYNFLHSPFAYTLFGTKPMSIQRLLPTKKAEAGWAAWEKICSLCKRDKFVLRKYLHRGNTFILAANLAELRKIYRFNRGEFQKILPKHSEESFLKSIKEGGPLFDQIIQNHFVLGVLLGYGTKNAKLFSKSFDPEANKENLAFFSKTIPPVFYSLSSKVVPVNFACDPYSEETARLRKLYNQEREKIGKRGDLFHRMILTLSP